MEAEAIQSRLSQSVESGKIQGELESFEDQLKIGKRFKRWAWNGVKRITSTVVDGALFGPRVVADMVELRRGYDLASWATLAIMAGGMAYALTKAPQQPRSVDTATPIPTVAADVRSSQAPTTYIPPSPVATITVRPSSTPIPTATPGRTPLSATEIQATVSAYGARHHSPTPRKP